MLCLGAVPVTIRPPHPQNLQTTLPTVRMIVDVSKSVLVLSNANVIKLLRSKEASNVVDIKSWPTTLDTDDMPKKKLPVVYRAPTAEMLAYLDFRYFFMPKLDFSVVLFSVWLLLRESGGNPWQQNGFVIVHVKLWLAL